MDLFKRKYKQKEVEQIVKEITSSYEDKLREQRERIEELLFDLNKVKTELNSYKQKDGQILDTLKDAEDKAHEIEYCSKLRYELAVKEFYGFSEKLESYFAQISDKYPSEKVLTDIGLLKEKLNKILQEIKEYDLPKSGEVFDPKAKINEYIVATGNNGFNLDEVLNPGKLELEELCRELGLIEEK